MTYISRNLASFCHFSSCSGESAHPASLSPPGKPPSNPHCPYARPSDQIPQNPRNRCKLSRGAELLDTALLFHLRTVYDAGTAHLCGTREFLQTRNPCPTRHSPPAARHSPLLPHGFVSSQAIPSGPRPVFRRPTSMSVLRSTIATALSPVMAT